MVQDIPQLSKIRKANLLCAQVEKIRTAQNALKMNAVKLVELIYQLPDRSREDLGTDGQTMSEREMVADIETSVATNQERTERVLKDC